MTRLFEAVERLAEWKVIVIIAFVTLVAYLGVINAHPAVPNIMEARNLVAARECVLDGHWLLPTLNGIPRIRKPPLPTWAAAAAMEIAGTTTSVHVGRIPSVIMTILSGVFLYLFSRRWLSKHLSLTASFATVTSILMYWEAGRATWDIFTVSFAFGGMWALFNALDRNRPWAPWVIAASALWAMSYLSKGPVTIYAVLLPFVLSVLMTKRRKGLRWWVLPVVLAVAVTTGMSWWIYVYFVYPETIQVMQSEATSLHTRHLKDFFYYFPFPLLVFPWTPALLGSFILPFIKKKDGERLISNEKRKELLFFLLWLALSILLISLVPAKKHRYAMTVFMPAAMAIAIFIGELKAHGLEGLPRALKGLWVVQVFQAPFFAVGIGGGLTYFIFKTGVSPIYVVILALFCAATFYKMLKDRNSVDAVVGNTVLVFVFAAVMAGFTARDIYGKDPKYDVEGAARVSAITAGERLYMFNNGPKVTWGMRRTSEVIANGAVVESFPALMIVKDAFIANFKEWAFTNRISYEETYRFRYDSRGDVEYMLFKLTDNRTPVERGFTLPIHNSRMDTAERQG